MKINKYIFISLIAFVLGILLTFFVIKKLNKEDTSQQSHVIAYQIDKMNKMIVAEQNYSDIYTYKSKKSLPGLGGFYSADKHITMLINAKAQATYDLSKMQIKVDSINKKIVLTSIPPVDIQIYPDVQFHDLDQSVFNKFEKDELNDVKRKGVEHIKKVVDETSLKKQAHEQLIKNLGEIYTIAKLYNWEVVDETPFAQEIKAFSERAQ